MVNVYTADMNADVAKPVMVFIHGGAFIIGSGNGESDPYGPNLLMDRDIVLVTINYRLGPFGFLSTEDAEAAGNYGLLDQSLALKWVRENIAGFGGDAGSVTIFGESAGAASVEYHVLSPRSRGLFHGAISQSGSSLCHWSHFDNIAQRTRTLAGLLECPTDSSRQILDCLRAKDAAEILEMRRRFEVPPILGIFPIIFGPRVDAERESPFLPAHPRTIMAAGSTNPVPFITGFNRNEGAGLLAHLIAGEGEGLMALEKDPVKYMAVLLGMDSAENRDEMARQVLPLLDADLPLSQQLATLDEIFSDTMMFHCVDEAANLFRQHHRGPTYYYHYAYRGSLSTTAMAGVTADLGVSHGDELLMMFANDAFNGVISHDDKKVSALLMDLWTSLAAGGAPHSRLMAESTAWLPMDKDARRYLNVDAGGASTLTTQDLPFHARIPFWNRVLSREGEPNALHKDEL